MTPFRLCSTVNTWRRGVAKLDREKNSTWVIDDRWTENLPAALEAVTTVLIKMVRGLLMKGDRPNSHFTASGILSASLIMFLVSSYD